MDQKNFSRPVELSQTEVRDSFWTARQELVRTVMYNEMYNALIAANKLVVDTDALRYANTDRTLYSIAS